jgi:hypothetical protein
MLIKKTDAGWEMILRVFAASKSRRGDKQHGDNTLTLLSNPRMPASITSAVGTPRTN